MSTRRYWTVEDLTYLREHYPHVATLAVAARLGRSVNMVYNKAHVLGLLKTEEYLRDPANRCRLFKHIGAPVTSLPYRFRPGHVPANKGSRRPGYAPGRMRDTQFQKGVRSGIAARNWVPLGTILPDAEGYLRIKVRDAVHGQEATGFGNTKVWPLYNRWLWEQQHGPIPPQHVVIFKDGNRAHCVIENLELLSMADNARRNSMWRNYPRELAEAIQMNGALKRKLRNNYGKKQDIGPAESSL